MSDPIADRMSPDTRAKWEGLRADGYKLLRKAHEIYMAHAAGRHGEVEDGSGTDRGPEPDSGSTGSAG